LNEDFTEKYIKQLIKKGGKEIPIISFLTVGKNIHGIGNGIVHDILFNARINPKRFISKLSDSEIDNLYHSLKNTLTEMILYNGRETELDLLGNSGQYKTIMAENSCNLPCPICGNDKHKEWFMGNKIYYCPTCQK
jgi:formamidopyrimidine-DNA glycosylase